MRTELRQTDVMMMMFVPAAVLLLCFFSRCLSFFFLIFLLFFFLLWDDVSWIMSFPRLLPSADNDPLLSAAKS